MVTAKLPPVTQKVSSTDEVLDQFINGISKDAFHGPAIITIEEIVSHDSGRVFNLSHNGRRYQMLQSINSRYDGLAHTISSNLGPGYDVNATDDHIIISKKYS